MALNPKQSEAAVNAAAAAVGVLCNSGKLRLYDGSQPATADDAIGAVNLLAELTFGNPAFGTPAAGVMAANAITKDSDADYTSVATWFRAWKSDGTTPVFDGSVGVGTYNLNMNSASIVIHAEVSVTSLSYTQPKSA